MAKRKHPLAVRDVLDGAVRRLAVSAAPMYERVELAASDVLRGLDREDLEAEERAVYDQIAGALARRTGGVGRMNAAVAEMPQSGLEQVAEDIVDLRDMVMGDAIRTAARGSRTPSRHRRAPTNRKRPR